MKNYKVSMQCTVFASVEVKAESEAKAIEAAKGAEPGEFDIEEQTLTPVAVEKVVASEPE